MFENDQEAFEFAVAQYCRGLDTVAVGCRGAECEYADGDEDHQCEASFSWAQCDSCGSTLGGDRLPAFGIWHDEDGYHDIEMSICSDCAMYHANGELPERWSQD